MSSEMRTTVVSVLLALLASLYWALVPVRWDARTGAGETLLGIAGYWLVVVLTVPVIIATAPLLWRRRGARLTAALLLLLFSLVGSFSVGLFYLPSCVAMFAAAALRGESRGV
jgi:hypothetical protein